MMSERIAIVSQLYGPMDLSESLLPNSLWQVHKLETKTCVKTLCEASNFTYKGGFWLIDWLMILIKTRKTYLVIQLFSMVKPFIHDLHIIHAQLNYTYIHISDLKKNI